MTEAYLMLFQNARWYSRRELAHALNRPDDRLTDKDIETLGELAGEKLIEMRYGKQAGRIGAALYEYRRVTK